MVGRTYRRVVENNPHWCHSQRLDPNGRFSSVAPWPPVSFRSRGPCPSGPSLLESTISGKSALPQPPLALAQPYSGSSMSTSTQGPDPSTEGLSSAPGSPIHGHPAEVLGQANDSPSLPVSPSLESPPPPLLGCYRPQPRLPLRSSPHLQSLQSLPLPSRSTRPYRPPSAAVVQHPAWFQLMS